MELDGLLGDEEPLADLAVRVALGDEPDDVDLPLGQLCGSAFALQRFRDADREAIGCSSARRISRPSSAGSIAFEM